MARPRSPTGRAKVIAARLADPTPVRHRAVRARRRQPVPTAGRHHLVGPVHRHAGQHGDPGGLRRYIPTPRSLAAASPADVEAIIKSTGFFRAKARPASWAWPGPWSSGSAARFRGPGGPRDPAGGGPQDGNVVRSVAFGLPGLPVDTHVGRLSRRLGLDELAQDPRRRRAGARRACRPGRAGCVQPSADPPRPGRLCRPAPRCTECLLADICPTAPTLPGQRAAIPPPSRARRPTAARVVEKSLVAAIRWPVTTPAGSPPSQRGRPI